MTEEELANACVNYVREILRSPGEIFEQKIHVTEEDPGTLIKNSGGRISTDMIKWTVTPNPGESIEVSAQPAIFAIVVDLLNTEGIGFGIYPDQSSLTIPLPRF